MKELIEALERLVKANKNNTGESVMGAIENAEKALQKAKKSQLDMTSYLLGREDAKLDRALQPELSAEEVLRELFKQLENEAILYDKDIYAYDIKIANIAIRRSFNLLTEFKNQK